MGDFPRKADGRRIFTAEFKRGVVQQILKGEKTLAEVSRELDIQPTVIRQWKRRVETGAATAVAADEEVVPASLLRPRGIAHRLTTSSASPRRASNSTAAVWLPRETTKSRLESRRRRSRTSTQSSHDGRTGLMRLRRLSRASGDKPSISLRR